MIKIAERQTRRGQRLELGISEDGNWVIALLDGKQVASRAGIGPAQPHKAGAEYTHQMGPVLILAAEAQKIEAARVEIIAHCQPNLRQQREQLAICITAILDEQQSRREHWYERGATGEMPQYDTPAYQAAIADLERFDAAHPEIKQQIEQEKAEMVERHLWD